MITYRQPFRGEYPISQRYGEVIQGVTYKGKPHTGIDYLCPFGTEILASADGTVLYSGYDGSGFGNLIIILHERNKATVYAHLSERYVYVNQKVRQGDVIGKSGSTGYSTGPHLHFEARSVWNDPESHKDPVMYLQMKSMADPEGNQTPSGSDSPDQESDSSIQGLCRVACEAANVRDWNTLGWKALVYKGERVYVFDDVKWMNNLPYRFIGAGLCMAERDADGTVILEKVKDEEEE